MPIRAMSTDSLRPAACLRQSQNSGGTARMLDIESIDWNQGTGIPKPPTFRLTWSYRQA